MGLDMYLNRINKDMWNFRDIYVEGFKTDKPDLYEVLKKYGYEHIYGKKTDYPFSSWYMYEQVAYWRKANAVHSWFVENVQDGKDDCNDYEVTKKQLQSLCDICEKIITTAVMIPHKITNGYQLIEGKWEPIMEDGKIVLNSDVIAEMLPVSDGFFFGSVDYDQYYMNDINYTYHILKEVIAGTNWETQYVYYQASW